jgi:lipoprotein-releasing system ATP-binding protein
MSDVLIKVNNISKSYSQGDIEIKVLSNFSLTINRGDFFAITGPSGSGKTTLLNILGLIDNFESGNILYFNNDISNFNEVKKDNLRLQHLGFVYQSNNLFDDFNITENVALPLLLQGYSKKEAYENSKEMLNSFGLSNRFKHTPKDLSGGEQQRVAIARALINNPDVVIADEPTGNLDHDTSNNVFDYLMKYSQNKSCAIVMATHNLSLASLANKKLEIGTKN